MERISTATRAIDLYGAGKDGFKDGDLPNSILPTDLNAAWFNHVQEEMARTIEASGQALSGADLTQLTKAIRRLAGANLNTLINGVTNLTVDQAGLVLVDATAGNCTINLPASGVVTGLSVGFNFYRVDSTSNIVTVNRSGADTIDGGTSIALAGQYAYHSLKGDGALRWTTLARSTSGAGSYVGVNTYSATQVLPVSAVGYVTVFAGAGAGSTFTLPAVGSVQAGSVIKIVHRSTGGHVLTVQRAGADVVLTGSSSVTSFPMRAGDHVLLAASPAGWIVAAGTTALTYSYAFAALLVSGAGYQRLPSGLILQWGTVTSQNGQANVNWPIAFPTAAFFAVATPFDNVSGLTNLLIKYTPAGASTTQGAFMAQSSASNVSITMSYGFIAIGH